MLRKERLFLLSHITEACLRSLQDLFRLFPKGSCPYKLIAFLPVPPDTLISIKGSKDPVRLRKVHGPFRRPVPFRGAGPVGTHALLSGSSIKPAEIPHKQGHQFCCRKIDLFRHGLQVFIRRKGKCFLQKDIPLIKGFRHFMKGDAALFHTFQQRHRHGPGASSLWQIGRVDIYHGQLRIHRHPIIISGADHSLTACCL